MKKLNYFLSFILSFSLVSVLLPDPAAAAVTWATHTVTVSQDILTALDPVLDTSSIGATYYAVTDVNQISGIYIVSLVGLDSSADPADWSITEALWLGTAAVSSDYATVALEGTTEYNTMTAAIFDGGGSPTAPVFPWEPGKKAYFGSRGVHEAGYGLSGWLAIDWVSGPTYGTYFYTNGVYASEDAQITYVCRDNTSVAIRAGNFLYAHLADAATLEIGNNIYKGVKFASLVTGSFNDSCGWASQAPGNYHLHWGFDGSSGYLTVEDWTLNTSSQIWTRGSESVGIGDAMLSSGSSYIDNGDTGDYNANLDGSHFWDSPIGSMISLVSKNLLPRFPEGQSRELGATYVNAAAVAIRIGFILLKSNFKLYIFVFVFLIIGILEPVRIVYAVYRMIKDAIPLA